MSAEDRLGKGGNEKRKNCWKVYGKEEVGKEQVVKADLLGYEE